MRMLSLISILLLLTGFNQASSSLASQEESSSSDFSESRTPTSYCGIYCVNAVATSFGRTSDPASIIQEKYLSGRFGSTAKDLEQLSSDLGLMSVSRQNLSFLDLELSNCPAILHVRTPGSVKSSHWMLFFGFEKNGKVRVYDPPRHQGSLTEGELLSIWDGVAIFVSDDQKHLPKYFYPFFVLISICVPIAGFHFTNRIGLNCKLEFLVVIVASVVFTHVCFPAGFLWNHLPQSILFAAHQKISHKDYSYEDIRKLHSRNEVQLIDARAEDAFDEYRLPDAKNLPVSSGILAIKNFSESLDHKKKIVVYCQNNQCGWAHKVAGLLEMMTQKPIGVFRGGVEEWYQKSLNE